MTYPTNKTNGEIAESRYDVLTRTETQLIQLANITEMFEKSAVANCRDANTIHRLRQVVDTLSEEPDLPAALAQDVQWLRDFLKGNLGFVGRLQGIADRVIKFREKQYGKK